MADAGRHELATSTSGYVCLNCRDSFEVVPEELSCPAGDPARDAGWWHARNRNVMLGLYPQAGRPETRNRRGQVTVPARPPTVRLCGPIGGARDLDDPAALRLEAERLLAAADALEAEAAGFAAECGQLDLEAQA